MKRLFKNFTYKEQVTLLYKWSFTNDFQSNCNIEDWKHY
ncbi:hypothetical protein HMPREF1077_01267 [Parabacteroides johnsonii CL02T12C29]|jgi:hypothetical protein|uniref:Uncharacterized protein n=1 Tax=Parabacteroides johnsonii CL02T12C29 TaxID=999419 RepID=K6A8G1_9BACT|nr:hypothetical protein HMPREF1077_01267 [Parabacteroides johnsonii CL02T12C29]CCX76742.1 unknown [Parabacteroides johnsonii CAG:246]